MDFTQIIAFLLTVFLGIGGVGFFLNKKIKELSEAVESGVSLGNEIAEFFAEAAKAISDGILTPEELAVIFDELKDIPGAWKHLLARIKAVISLNKQLGKGKSK